MYMILWWVNGDEYLSCVKNKDDSIKLFETLKEADEYANKHKESDSMKIISIEAVKE